MKITFRFVLPLAMSVFIFLLPARASTAIKLKNGNMILAVMDFDLMMRQAPVLDLRDPKFDREDAELWSVVFHEIFSTACREISAPFGEQFTAISEKVFALGQDEAPKHFREFAPLVEKIAPQNQADIFVKAYVLRNFADAGPVMEGAKYLETLTMNFVRPFKMKEYSKMESFSLSRLDLWMMNKDKRIEAAAKMREYERQFRLVIYNPATSENEYVKRRREWAIFDSVAS